jgi:alginate O-acetyltransferase complex protein AlgI
MFFEGIWRFALGMGKKVIIANTLGSVADQIFALPSHELNSSKAWLGALCYTFQIYFDFSGYSDMAIGLARMFGFHFPENFNQPYRSQSVTEFWRRWHMTMSNWFRDFVYIPLGGNRVSPRRTYLNLWVVFFLCGLWHGAAWTFVAWGLWHGLLLVAERWGKERFDWSSKGILGTTLTFLLVLIGWVPFRADSLSAATMFISRMLGLTEGPLATDLPIWFYLTPDVWFCLALAVLFSWFPTEKLKGMRLPEPVTVLAQGSVSVLLLVYCAAALSKAAFNPFIYFRF